MKQQLSLMPLLCLVFIVTMGSACSDDPSIAPEPGDNSLQPDVSLTDTMEPDANAADVDRPPLTGGVAFVKPEAQTVYTRDSVELELEAAGDVSEFELVLDADEVLDTFAGLNLIFTTWSAEGRDEGSYELSLRYTVDGTQRVHEDTRTVIVDRTAPTITGSTPLANSETALARANEPITVTFNEPMDPASMTAETMTLEVENQSFEYTISLSADGLTATLDFDRDLVLTPYEATLTLAGVRDLAGNVLEGTTTLWWFVPSWFQESIAADVANLALYHVLEIDGVEYLIARQVNQNPVSSIKVFRNQEGEWTEVAASAAHPLGIWAMDATIHENKIVIAFSVIEADQRRIRMLVFDPANDSLNTRGGFVAHGNTEGNAVSLSLAMRDDRILIAATNNGELRIFESIASTLPSTNTVALTDFPNLKSEKIVARIRPDLTRDVVFAQCNNAVVPCPLNYIRHIKKANDDTSWELIPGTMTTNADVGQCDKFESFDALFEGDEPISILAHRGTCTNGASLARGMTGEGLKTSIFSNKDLTELIPEFSGDKKVNTHMTHHDGVIHVLFTTENRLDLTRVEGNTLAYVSFVMTGLIPGANANNQFRWTEFFQTSRGKVAFFRFGATTYVFRFNE